MKIEVAEDFLTKNEQDSEIEKMTTPAKKADDAEGAPAVADQDAKDDNDDIFQARSSESKDDDAIFQARSNDQSERDDDLKASASPTSKDDEVDVNADADANIDVDTDAKIDANIDADGDVNADDVDSDANADADIDDAIAQNRSSEDLEPSDEAITKTATEVRQNEVKDDVTVEGEELEILPDNTIMCLGQNVEPVGIDEAEAAESAKADENDDSSVSSTDSDNPEIEPILSHISCPDLVLDSAVKKTMDEFSVAPLPSNWANATLLEQGCLDDDEVWVEYGYARRILAQACEDAGKSDDPATVSSRAYKNYIRELLEKEWKATVLGAVLLKHTYQRATRVVLKNPALEEATIVSTIFSPYLFPRAVQLCHLYNRKDQEFSCSWHIQFVSLAERAAEKGQDLMGYYWRPHLVDMIELCSNEYLTMPTDDIGWWPVENIQTSYFTPSIVRKIRKWLFGHFHSYHLFNDFEMMKYVLGSCGTINNMNTLYGNIGHHWNALPVQAEDMQIYGTVKNPEVEKAMKIGTNWLEYHTRLVTGSLRTIDQWYDPYDQRKWKGEWGEAFVEYLYQTYGIYDDDDEVREKPWTVWDRSARGVYYDQTLQNSTMGVVGSL